MTSDAILINWYVDEPTCLGVTPYISPYIRMVAGVFAERGLTTKCVTIDQLHRDPVLVTSLSSYRYGLMIAGVKVSDKYLA